MSNQFNNKINKNVGALIFLTSNIGLSYPARTSLLQVITSFIITFAADRRSVLNIELYRCSVMVEHWCCDAANLDECGFEFRHVVEIKQSQ